MDRCWSYKYEQICLSSYLFSWKEYKEDTLSCYNFEPTRDNSNMSIWMCSKTCTGVLNKGLVCYYKKLKKDNISIFLCDNILRSNTLSCRGCSDVPENWLRYGWLKCGWSVTNMFYFIGFWGFADMWLINNSSISWFTKKKYVNNFLSSCC